MLMACNNFSSDYLLPKPEKALMWYLLKSPFDLASRDSYEIVSKICFFFLFFCIVMFSIICCVKYKENAYWSHIRKNHFL